MKTAHLGFVLGSIFASAPGHAALITYTSAFSTYSEAYNVTQTGGPGPYSGSFIDFDFVELPRFDPSLGTLESVEIAFRSNYDMYMYGTAADNQWDIDTYIFVPGLSTWGNSAGMDMNMSGSLNIALFHPGNSSRTLNLQSINADCYHQRNGLPTESNPAVSCSDDARRLGTYDAIIATDLFDISSFIGLDPINLYVSADSDFGGSCYKNSENAVFGDDGDTCIFNHFLGWNGWVDASYTYSTIGGGEDPTSVPEPGTLSLLGIGLLGIGAARRRRKG